MKIRTILLASVLAVAGATLASAQEEPAADTELDPVVLGILKESTDFLAAADSFGFHSETNYDAVQDSGATVEFGSARKVLVERPNRMRVETVKRDGASNVLVLDGKNLWAWSEDHNVYATTAQVGDIDESIDFVISVLRVKAPLGDLVSPDLYSILTNELEEAIYVDQAVVTGVHTHHLLLRKDYVDEDRRLKRRCGRAERDRTDQGGISQ